MLLGVAVLVAVAVLVGEAVGEAVVVDVAVAVGVGHSFLQAFTILPELSAQHLIPTGQRTSSLALDHPHTAPIFGT